jgi:hypothetical protein
VVEIRPDDHRDEADWPAEKDLERNLFCFSLSRSNRLKNIIFSTAKVTPNLPISPQFQGFRGLGRLLLRSSRTYHSFGDASWQYLLEKNLKKW